MNYPDSCCIVELSTEKYINVFHAFNCEHWTKLHFALRLSLALKTSIKENRTYQVVVVASFRNWEHEDMNCWQPLHLRQAECNSDASPMGSGHSFAGYAVDTFDSVPYFVLVPFGGDGSLDTYFAFVPHAFVTLDTVKYAAFDIYMCMEKVVKLRFHQYSAVN